MRGSVWRVFDSQQLHLQQLAFGLTLKVTTAGCFPPAVSAKFDRHVDVGDVKAVSAGASTLPRTEMPWFFTLFLPRLSSNMVSILLMYWAIGRECKQVMSHSSFNCQGNVNQQQLSVRFLFPLRCYILPLLSLKNRD